jgi:hypothetical protein
MRVSGRKWTKEETETLVRLRKLSVSFQEIASALNRTRKAVEWRWQVIHFTPDHKERRRQTKNANAYKYRVRPKKQNPLRFVPEKMLAPDVVLIERDIRLSAPRTITAHIFGDPPPGYSALDKREVRP